MKCAGCGNEVSIADARCKTCGRDLLQFGATSSEVFRGDAYANRSGQQVKDQAFGALWQEKKALADGLDVDERRVIAAAFDQRLGGVLVRHMSEEAVDGVYAREVMTLLEQLSPVIRAKLENNLKSNLGENLYHYYQKWPEQRRPPVIKMLAAGELVFLMVDNKGIDLSVKMFEFFKVTEIVTKYHGAKRQEYIAGNDVVKNVFRSIDGDVNKVRGPDIPSWLDGDISKGVDSHKRTFLRCLGMLSGISREVDITKLYNSRSIGLSIYFFGRERLALGTETFTINNIFDVKGSMAEREQLARDLCELQEVRNDKVHEKVSVHPQEVMLWRDAAYRCLRSLPVLLPV